MRLAEGRKKRYKAALIDSEQYLLTCMRYIELNPVRAQNMVNHPAEYWRIGATKQDKQSAYRQLFRAHIPEMMLKTLREAANKAWVMGGKLFKARVSKQIDLPLQSSGHGGDRKSEAYRRD